MSASEPGADFLGPEVRAFVSQHASGDRRELAMLQSGDGRLWAYQSDIDCWTNGAERFPAEDRAMMDAVVGPLVEVWV